MTRQRNQCGSERCRQPTEVPDKAPVEKPKNVAAPDGSEIPGPFQLPQQKFHVLGRTASLKLTSLPWRKADSPGGVGGPGAHDG